MLEYPRLKEINSRRRDPEVRKERYRENGMPILEQLAVTVATLTPLGEEWDTYFQQNLSRDFINNNIKCLVLWGI